ncbi:hypothetical protein [Spirosoma pollinicola]|uniref:DUF4348 domain-containing protein n=1 Tax=Spirosoma pollinicola TaxID=2057025 RepID=A0A2K8Z108_9BACT|nr:hypothetical protein [Spirosoma pollinicola]AUD03535.1 hypothetical protein CWM47_17895 [Spirosoma pollinicola]
MIRINTQFFLRILLCLFLASCGARNEKKEWNSKQPQNEIENFDTFYRRFYADSLFQANRVIFPLEGYNQNLHELGEDGPKEDTIPKVYYTQRSELGFLNPPPLKDSIYEDVLYKVGLKKTDTLVVEKFWIDESGSMIEKHFKPIQGKWHLVYFYYIDN